jgi:hypothetical protein
LGNEVNADDVQFGANLTAAFGMQIVMGGPRNGPITHAFGQQTDGLTHNNIAVPPCGRSTTSTVSPLSELAYLLIFSTAS